MAVQQHLNFVEGEGIAIQAGPNPADATVVDVEIANTIGSLLDAKGDLLTASDLDTPARLEAGTDGQVLTVDSSTDTGLAWTAAASGDPADDTLVWMPLVDSDGTVVLDDTGVIPTLIPLIGG